MVVRITLQDHVPLAARVRHVVRTRRHYRALTGGPDPARVILLINWLVLSPAKSEAVALESEDEVVVVTSWR